MIQSIARASRILEVLAETGEGVSLQQLCARVGIKAPTAHNLLSTLVELGYVDRLRNPPRYQLGGAPRWLADRFERGSLAGRAEPELLALIRQVPVGSVVFSELVDGEVVIRRRVTPEAPRQVQRPMQSVLGLYGSASGLAFQAFSPARQRELLRAEAPFAESGAGWWASLETLDEFLASARRLGYVRMPDENRLGFRAAAPIIASDGRVLAVLGLSAPVENLPQMDPQITVQAIRTAAERLGSLERANQNPNHTQPVETAKEAIP